MVTKAEQRRKLRATLAAVSPAERQVTSEKIRERLIHSSLWHEAKSVGLFAALPDEPDLMPLLALTAAGKQNLAFPLVRGDQLEFRHVTQRAQLRPGSWQIPEPDAAQCSLIDPAAFSLILVPGLGFDRRGFRLGRGRGYYDRLLHSLPSRVKKIGLFLARQELAEIPTEPHDAPLHAVLTENEFISITL